MDIKAKLCHLLPDKINKPHHKVNQYQELGAKHLINTQLIAADSQQFKPTNYRNYGSMMLISMTILQVISEKKVKEKVL